MKKSKILVLVAALLVAVMALTACGGSVAIKDYLNPDYDTSAQVITAAEKISALKDYDYVTDNGYIAVFSMTDEDDLVTYKLVSLADASVVATLKKADTTYTFSAYGPAYLVTSVTAVEDADPKTTYTLYDVTGSAIDSSKYFATAEVIYGDYILYNRVVYEINAKGALTKLADVPEYISADIDLVSDDYFYVSADRAIVVYDHQFNYVSFYELPSYAEEYDCFLLDNGNYLVQYLVELDSEATKYDIYEVSSGLTYKFDLVTLIVSAEDGSAKEIKFDYVIEEVVANSDVYDAEEDNNMFIEDSFENIVVYYPIENGQINQADSAAEMCFMDNKGKLGDSLKLYDDMLTTTTPRKIADDLYVTYGATGIVLVNGEGEIVKRVTNFSGFRLAGNYFIGEDAIYSADLSKVVYDLKENEVVDYETMGDSILMRIKLDDGDYKLVLFVDGETKTIYNSATMGKEKSYGYVNEIDGYFIYDIAEETYTYYNAKGEKLLKTDARLSFIAHAEDTLLAYVTVEDEKIYYLFK